MGLAYPRLEDLGLAKLEKITKEPIKQTLLLSILHPFASFK